MRKVVAFGNPLLDTIVLMNDNYYLLDKYNLDKDGQKEVSEEEMKHLSEDLESQFKNRTYVAGGCAQNSLRVLQWLSEKKHKSFIFGSVGNDSDADLLKKLMESDGVTAHYTVQKSSTTGKTISLVNGINRSLVAHLGAAEILTVEDMLSNEYFKATIENADYIYIEGYFLTKRESVARYILNVCNDLNKIVIFNISGEYVCDLVPETVQYFIKNCNIVFGNRREFEALRKMMEFSSIEELIEILSRNGRNKMKNYGNMYIITDGEKSGECYYKNGKRYQFEVEKIDKCDFKDTTGAGDAFVGGFLCGLCEEKPIEEIIKLSCSAASEIIKQIGCAFPKK